MKKILVVSMLLLSALALVAQGNMNTRKWRKTEADSLVKAQLLFEEQNFVMALPVFSQIQKNHPNELYLKYVTGISGLYRSDTHDDALDLLLQVYAKNKKAGDIEYDLARAYHYNLKFDEALAMLDKFEGRKLTPEQKQNSQTLRAYCNNAKKMVAAPVDAEIENIGDIVNTTASEYAPVLSSDESVMIITYRGDQSTGGLQNAYNQPDPMGIYYEDVFVTHKENGEWTSPQSIGDNINTNVNDAAIAISNDGMKFFIFRDDGLDGGDIYISRLVDDKWSVPERLQGDVNTSSWEGSVSMSADEKTIYFSSERPGGFGGKDIYSATANPDGSWGNVKNLGAVINTSSDDDAPFVHPDGKTLTFSSAGLNSMGGYDIFVTHKNADSSWTTPENLGYPINTPDDDIYFVLNADGKRGYYSSGKEGGFGLQDIYVVSMPEKFEHPVLAMVHGTVTLDGNPVEAAVQADILDESKPYGTYKSRKSSGAYLVNLEAGHSYTITYKLDSFPDQKKIIDLKNITAFKDSVIDIRFVSKKDTVPSRDTALVKSLPAKDTIPAKADTVKMTANEVIDKYGNSSKEGLEFKVQIAAYNLPKNYTYSHLKGLGKVEELKLEDGITRFTIGGSFKTLNEAIAHKKKVVAAGQKDAFVTAIYQGRRVYLEDLEKLGLIQVPK